MQVMKARAAQLFVAMLDVDDVKKIMVSVVTQIVDMSWPIRQKDKNKKEETKALEKESPHIFCRTTHK